MRYLFLALSLSLLFLPWPRVRQVEIEGLELLRPEEMREVVGVKTELPLWYLPLLKVREHPRIRSLRLGFRWPDTLQVMVEERKPRAFLSREGRLWEVDGEGVVLGEPRVPPGSLPVITGERPEEALRLLREVGEAASRISEIHVAAEGLKVYSLGGVSFLLRPRPEEEEIEALRLFLRSLPPGVTALDLRSPRRPAARFLPGEEKGKEEAVTKE